MVVVNFTLFVLWCCLFSNSHASSATPRASTGVNFGIGLTTIPPRFSSVHHVVKSWLQQDHPPAIIVIFLPKKYTMFVNGIGKNKNKNFITLQNELKRHFATEMEEGRVVIQIVPKDLGPLTKYVGMLEFFSAFDEGATSVVDRWVIGDDDVHYAANTLTGYANAILNPSSSVSASSASVDSPDESIMTHFNVHSRLEVQLGDGDDDSRHPIAHLQVATSLIHLHLYTDTYTYTVGVLVCLQSP